MLICLIRILFVAKKINYILLHLQVKHYHIKQNSNGQFYLSEKHCCATIPELVEYHSYNAGGLACRLKGPPGRSKPATAGLSQGKWEIDPTELTLLEELGSGESGWSRETATVFN